VIHYHGTPITPRATLLALAGRSFCVSYAAPADLKACLQIGQSIMLDNGAFSVWTRGLAPDWPGYYAWCERVIGPVHWAVVPDVIDGTAEDNLALAAQWPHPRQFSAVVWHLHEPLDHLARLAGEWPRVCFGSSGAYADPTSDQWHARIDAAWNLLERTGRRPWVHMLRAMSQASEGPWPFASADSTNVARNHAGAAERHKRDAAAMAASIDAQQPPIRWASKPEQMEFAA
jgi:hypothetical protein